MEEAIHNAAQGPGVLVPAASQRVVFRLAGGVALDRGHRPVAGGVRQPGVRGAPPLDEDGPSGALRDGGNAAMASQGLEIGLAEDPAGFRDDDGQDDRADSGNGPHDFDDPAAFRRSGFGCP